jgi:hypothetical protein
MTRDVKPRDQFIYEGQQVRAILQPLPDGRWRLIVRKREIGTFASREEAIDALDREGGAL